MKAVKTVLVSTKYFFVVTLLCLNACTSVETGAPVSVMQWHKLGLTFNGPNTSESADPNPFMDYRLDVVFTSPAGKEYRVPGFYAADGQAGESGATAGNKWRVLFSPGELGKWRYEAKFVGGENIAVSDSAGVSAGFFDGQAGFVNVVASDKQSSDKDFRAKGKLEYVGEHYLRFKGNQEYFLKGGANSPEVFLGYGGFDATPSDRDYAAHVEDWNKGDPTWHGGKGKGIIGLVNYFASLDNNVIYFLSMNVDGDGKQVWPWIAPDAITRYDVSKLEQWGIVFDHMTAKGVMAHFVLTETENESLFEWYESKTTGGFSNSRKLYYREMIARFGYLPGLTWNVGEENGWADYSGDDAQKKANTTEQRKWFSDYIRALTVYNDHIVVHNGPDQNYYIFNKPDDNILGHKSYTGPSLQGRYTSKNIYNDVLKFRRLSAQHNHKWVVTMDEPYIETKEGGDINVWRQENVWATLMAGGAGIELYLGGGIDITQQNLREFEAYYKTTAIALNFFKQHVPFWRLEPDSELLANAWVLKQEGEFYLLYFKQGGSGKVNLPKGEYSVDWFNPVNGQFQKGSLTRIIGGTFQSIGQELSEERQDWVCIIKKVPVAK